MALQAKYGNKIRKTLCPQSWSPYHSNIRWTRSRLQKAARNAHSHFPESLLLLRFFPMIFESWFGFPTLQLFYVLLEIFLIFLDFRHNVIRWKIWNGKPSVVYWSELLGGTSALRGGTPTPQKSGPEGTYGLKFGSISTQAPSPPPPNSSATYPLKSIWSYKLEEDSLHPLTRVFETAFRAVFSFRFSPRGLG